MVSFCHGDLNKNASYLNTEQVHNVHTTLMTETTKLSEEIKKKLPAHDLEKR